MAAANVGNFLFVKVMILFILGAARVWNSFPCQPIGCERLPKQIGPDFYPRPNFLGFISAPLSDTGPEIESKLPNYFSVLRLQKDERLRSRGPYLGPKISSKNIKNSTLQNINLSKSKREWGLALLVTLSGDVHQNPGPRTPKFPCGICSKACTWKDRAVACDDCDVWFHTSCLGMNSLVYKGLSGNNVSWHCWTCGLPNFSSKFFQSFENLEQKNPFECLQNFSSDFGHISDFKPSFHSTPTKSDKQRKDKNRSIFRTLVFNFRSLFSKREELLAIIQEEKPDIIIGTETWLKESVRDSELLIDDYFEIYRRDRGTKKKGGGVMICVKKDLVSEIVHKGENSESLFCKIQTSNNKPLIIGAVYRPPTYESDCDDNICKDLSEIFDKNKQATFWVAGDFNLPDIDWETHQITGKQYSNKTNSKFIDLFHDLGLEQQVKIPTRESSILDLFLTNRPSQFLNFSIIPGLGDHDCIKINSEINPKRKRPVKRTIHLWNKICLEKLKNEAKNFGLYFIKNHSISTNVNTMWKCIKKNLLTIMEDNIPTKTTSSRPNQPWLNTNVKKLVRRKKRWYKKMKNCSSERVKNKYLEIKKMTQRECRKAHVNYLNDIINEDTDLNNKKLYTYIKGKSQGNSSVGDLRGREGRLYQDPKIKAKLLNEQFSSVFTKPKLFQSFNMNQKTKTNTMLKIKVSENGVFKLMSKINENKATGPDGIPGKLLKLCAKELTPVFTILFQASLDQGIVPEDWKLANIVPLFKKGDKKNPENYRPVSLTSIPCKLLEHIVHSSIMDHLDKHKILSDVQHGFRQSRSCESQLITTTHDFVNCLDNKGQIDAILLDFSKAFDKVDHAGLLCKLDHYGIRNSLHFWISSFLSNRTQKVLLEGHDSTALPVLSGVPQGTVLGPLLFLIYINDMGENLTEGTKLRLFADDSLLYREIKTKKDQDILQNDLDKLQKWEKEWSMHFHPDKCQVLKITNKLNKGEGTYTIHNTLLKETPAAKYLGITIDSKLKWNVHVDSTYNKANNTLAFLRRHLTSCPPAIKERCFKTYVRPILEYGSSVWDPYLKKDIEKLEKIQRRAARFVKNDYRYTSSPTQLMDGLGWVPLAERRAQAKVKVLYKANNNMLHIPLNHLVLNKSSTRRAGENYLLPRSNTDTHLHSFYPNTLRLWNFLPKHIKSAATLESFTNELDNVKLRCSYSY